MLTSRDARYIKSLRYFLKSLASTGYSSEVVLLIADNGGPLLLRKPTTNSLDDRKKSHPHLFVKQIFAPTLEINSHFDADSKRYSKMLGKIHFWALVEYERIVYYDLDVIFFKNPLPTAIKECSASICATVDEGMTKYFGKPSGSYFNCGFLVLKPDRGTYEWLLSKKHLAENQRFVEQDMLNILFENKWGKLSPEYNRMHFNLNQMNSQTIAVHEKYWNLQKQIKDSRYIWNQFRH